MRKCHIFLYYILMTVAILCHAESVDDVFMRGMVELKGDHVAKAAKTLALAAEMAETAGDDAKAVEINSTLYWCKKKFTLADTQTVNGDAAVTKRIDLVFKKRIELNEAQHWLDAANAYAATQKDPLLVAIRYFEVADRFKGTDAAMTAMDQSLKQMQMLKMSPQDAKADSLKAPNKQISPADLNELKPTDNVIAKTSLKHSVPKADLLKASRTTVQDLFKSEYVKTSQLEVTAFAEKLLNEGMSTADDPVAQYVLLQEASNVAVRAGNLALAFKAVTEMGKRYDINGTLAKLDILAKVSSFAKTPDMHKTIVDSYLILIDEATADNDYDAAIKMLGSASSEARMAQSLPLVSKIQLRTSELNELKSEFKKFKDAERTLIDKPNDPAASLATGKFKCFVIGDWEHGLPFLAKCDDSEIKTVAEKDIGSATGSEPIIFMAVADSRWSLSTKQTGKKKLRLQERALSFYEKAFPGLAGLAKVTCEKKLTDARKAVVTSDSRTINLIKLAATQVSSLPNLWNIVDGDLVTKKGAIWIIGYEPPEEYDFKIEFTRFDIGNGTIGQTGSRNGLAFTWLMAHYNNSYRFEVKSTVTKAEIFTNRRHVSILKVRKTSIEVWLDGKKVGTVAPDATLGEGTYWRRDGHDPRLGVITESDNCTFYAIEVNEITGSGRIVPKVTK